MKAVCAVMQNILETSDVPVYNVNTRTGVWRILTTRPRKSGLLSKTLVKRLTDESNSFKITSIYLQKYEGLSAPDNDPVEALLFGEARVGKVVGIEVNAALNNMKNVTFVNSKTTDAMEDLLRKKREENEKHLNRIVAISDPPPDESSVTTTAIGSCNVLVNKKQLSNPPVQEKMVKMELFCAIVGVAESVFSVMIDNGETVDDLKDAIKGKNEDIKCPARNLQLFLAKQPVEEEGGQEVVPVYHPSAEKMKEKTYKWLPDEHRAALKLLKGESDDYINALTTREQILGSKTLATWFYENNNMEFPSNHEIHVLIVEASSAGRLFQEEDALFASSRDAHVGRERVVARGGVAACESVKELPHVKESLRVNESQRVRA
eukprot:jgi/Phyca11/12966/fgenesh1_pg.PHYCAscaffold_2_\